MDKRVEYLIQLADELDKRGFIEFAAQVDELIRKYAQSYPDWGAQPRQQKEYALFEQFRNKEITEQQYKDGLKKLDEQGRMERDPFLEQKLYRKIQQEKVKPPVSQPPPPKK